MVQPLLSTYALCLPIFRVDTGKGPMQEGEEGEEGLPLPTSLHLAGLHNPSQKG